MVMLQNKKTSEQIIKDLHPFLGADGSRLFVTWLWSKMAEVVTSHRLIVAESTYESLLSFTCLPAVLEQKIPQLQ
jgi:hypothetical protein